MDPHIHTVDWQEHLPFLEYSFISFRFVLLPPNSQLVFLFASRALSLPLLLLLLLPCLTAWSSVLQSHMYLKLILMGAPAIFVAIVLRYFIHSFTFVLILLVFVATLVQDSNSFFLCYAKSNWKIDTSQPTISKFMHADSLTLCHTDPHCLLSFAKHQLSWIQSPTGTRWVFWGSQVFGNANNQHYTISN